MTDAPTPPPPVANPRLPGRLRWLLVGSLTLNLLVVGAVVGTALRFAGGDRPLAGVDRSLGFGPWSGGLNREDFRALHNRFEQSGRDLRSARRDAAEDREALIAVLRADPFDPAALDVVAARMRARMLDRLDLGQALIRAHVVAMAPAARRAFADRLERHMHHGRDRSGDRSGVGKGSPPGH